MNEDYELAKALAIAHLQATLRWERRAIRIVCLCAGVLAGFYLEVWLKW